jgi:hypothetical protein
MHIQWPVNKNPVTSTRLAEPISVIQATIQHTLLSGTGRAAFYPEHLQAIKRCRYLIRGQDGYGVINLFIMIRKEMK